MSCSEVETIAANIMQFQDSMGDIIEKYRKDINAIIEKKTNTVNKDMAIVINSDYKDNSDIKDISYNISFLSELTKKLSSLENLFWKINDDIEILEASYIRDRRLGYYDIIAKVDEETKLSESIYRLIHSAK